jgi:hypothetical protein
LDGNNSKDRNFVGVAFYLRLSAFIGGFISVHSLALLAVPYLAVGRDGRESTAIAVA